MGELARVRAPGWGELSPPWAIRPVSIPSHFNLFQRVRRRYLVPFAVPCGSAEGINSAAKRSPLCLAVRAVKDLSCRA